jgi:putative flippase GtrA/ubiquinone/menaquinone biosynthesis C-methylase UbiE
MKIIKGFFEKTGRLGPFALVGAFGLLLSVILIKILMLMGVDYLRAGIGATIFCLIMNFFLLEIFVFHDLRNSSKAFVHRMWQAISFNSATTVLQLSLYAFFVEFFHWWPIPSQILSVGVIFFGKFLFNSKFIYAATHSDEMNEAPKIVGSPSLEKPDYWWFVVRGRLLKKMMQPYVTKNSRILDIGSADGPSVEWLKESDFLISTDIDPRGLEGNPKGVVADALRLPFDDGTFTTVSAFDVIEHLDPEATALEELHRILDSSGVLLASVPAYEWAWTSFDDHNHHFRRYTSKRLEWALEKAGFEIEQISYGFFSTFPFFALERLLTRVKESGDKKVVHGEGEVPRLPTLPKVIEKMFYLLAKIDEFFVAKVRLPFGSSVFVVARKKILS